MSALEAKGLPLRASLSAFARSKKELRGLAAVGLAQFPAEEKGRLDGRGADEDDDSHGPHHRGAGRHDETP
eukprot:1765244-Pyramimonas_sp.AAC.1